MARKVAKVLLEHYKYKQCPLLLCENAYLQIRHRRLQMLIHSHIYYRLNTNILDDKQFDKWAYELRDLQAKYPEESAACDLAEEFEGWDGTTGFHLPEHDWIDGIARSLLRK